VSGIKTIDEVIPDAFGPRTLEAYAAADPSTVDDA